MQLFWINRRLSEEGDYLNDGTHTLILNASSDWEGVSDELKGIFQLVLRQPASFGQLGAQIMDKIDEIKHSKTGGRKEGTDEAIIKLIPDMVALTNDRQAVIKILMTKMNLSQE